MQGPLDPPQSAGLLGIVPAQYPVLWMSFHAEQGVLGGGVIWPVTGV